MGFADQFKSAGKKLKVASQSKPGKAALGAISSLRPQAQSQSTPRGGGLAAIGSRLGARMKKSMNFGAKKTKFSHQEG